VYPLDFISAAISSFSLVSLAEIGDKSQLVCMALAARHRHWPVLLGASAAFLLLNLLAVLFGASVAIWLPEVVIALIVGLMFLAFGVQALRSGVDDDGEALSEKPGHGIFLTAFSLIFLSEFGDKTQIAVAGLSTSFSASAVWLGSSIALILTSAAGIWAGKRLLSKLPVNRLHKIGGMMFLTFSAVAGYRTFELLGY